jgi:Asp-tRNA(Asn)/Glu-tRNA(Gln) amidotransferase C subunit
VDRALVIRLAEAARIELAAEELDRIAAQLSDILDQIAPLAELGRETGRDDGAVGAPDLSARDVGAPDAAPAQRLRADEPGADRLHGTLARFAPEVREGFFTVPLLPTHGGKAP